MSRPSTPGPFMVNIKEEEEEAIGQIGGRYECLIELK